MRSRSLCAAVVLLLLSALAFAADDPKQTPANTINISFADLPKPQTFAQPIKFYIDDVIDRSGNAQPMLVLKGRGGVYLDQEPVKIMRAALEQALKSGDLLATDKAGADFLLTAYVFHFGLAEGSGYDFYGKVDLNIVVKNAKSGKSQQITALGTAIENAAFRKKTLLKNVKENIETALEEAMRNFMRGTKLRDAVLALAAAPAPAPAPPAPPQ